MWGNFFSPYWVLLSSYYTPVGDSSISIMSSVGMYFKGSVMQITQFFADMRFWYQFVQKNMGFPVNTMS